MKSAIHRIEIEPSSNGGFTVKHHYKPTVKHSSGANFGGLSMSAAEPKVHTFGKGEQGALTAHLAQALGLGNAGEEAEETVGGQGKNQA